MTFFRRPEPRWMRLLWFGWKLIGQAPLSPIAVCRVAWALSRAPLPIGALRPEFFEVESP